MFYNELHILGQSLTYEEPLNDKVFLSAVKTLDKVLKIIDQVQGSGFTKLSEDQYRANSGNYIESTLISRTVDGITDLMGIGQDLGFSNKEIYEILDGGFPAIDEKLNDPNVSGSYLDTYEQLVLVNKELMSIHSQLRDIFHENNKILEESFLKRLDSLPELDDNLFTWTQVADRKKELIKEHPIYEKVYDFLLKEVMPNGKKGLANETLIRLDNIIQVQEIPDDKVMEYLRDKFFSEQIELKKKLIPYQSMLYEIEGVQGAFEGLNTFYEKNIMDEIRIWDVNPKDGKPEYVFKDDIDFASIESDFDNLKYRIQDVKSLFLQYIEYPKEQVHTDNPVKATGKGQ